ncbi:hypothetical protein VR41_05235 [Streptomyces sp. NRRL B-1568]|nr:hypothetical protein VR41_05235 [Streptomyces sp. NRRL B-1568]
MQLAWDRPGVLRITAHAYEFAALVAAARYVAEAAPEEIPDEALEQVRRVLEEYEVQVARLREGREGKP